jgi:signal transduction histidine kinase
LKFAALDGVIHWAPFMGATRVSSAQKLLAIFILTIFIPGLLLAVVGARALWQERRLADRQLRDRLDHAADTAVERFTEEVGKVDSLLEESPDPEKVVRNLPADGSWAYIARRDATLSVFPHNILPYELNPTVQSSAVFPELWRIEQLEMQEGPQRTIVAYRELLTTAPPQFVPEIRHRMARVLRKAGRESESLQLWRDVEKAGGVIGSLPADLVASFELASMDDGVAKQFYQQLIEGRWRLEKSRYLYYLSEVQKRLKRTEQDDGRLSLAEAVESVSGSSARVVEVGNRKYFAFRRETPFAALVVSPEFLQARIWPKVLNGIDPDARVVRIIADGQILHSSTQATVSTTETVRSLDAARASWRLEVIPKDAAAFYSAMNRNTELYATMLALVVISLASGGYFITRTVRRELEVARMKSDFVSTVSHEFRSPLTGIRQLGEMLARDRITDDRKRHQYYELIVRESERLARLVENVLDFSRMEAGRKQYRFEPLDTAAWLSGVAEEFQTEAARSGYQVKIEIPEHLPAISGDREALSTALRNLLDNACKYSPQSKSVWLQAEAKDGGVHVRVRDRGIGISVREQRQIFEKFYRGGSLANEVKGAGLGLSLVQHIVAAHQGEVLLESREGEGSTFTLCLRGAS